MKLTPKKLPEGIAPPKPGWVYVGEGVKGIKPPWACFVKQWDYDATDAKTNGLVGVHYAVPKTHPQLAKTKPIAKPAKPRAKKIIRWAGSPDSDVAQWLRINELSKVRTKHFCIRITIETT